MKNLYCKKTDLTIFSKFRKMYIPDYHLYFSSEKDYTDFEVETKIREKKDEIIERLRRKFNSPVRMIIKYPVKQINVKGENYGLIFTDSGVISVEMADIIEI